MNNKFKILLSATPLTGTSVIKCGKDYDRKFLNKKIAFLLKRMKNVIENNKMGDELDYGVVLKTVYYEKEDKLELKTRCWYFKNDLYNIGKTPREMFSAAELKKFLSDFSGDRSKLVVSLGIKSVDFSLWQKFFDSRNCYLTGVTTIEINARHTIRELTKFYLGSETLDEYMTPTNSESLWNNISAFFIELNKLGKKYKKQIFIKLPFRSDLLILCRFLDKIIEENKGILGTNYNYGIAGVTLINTIKSPYPAVFNLIDGEKVKIQQVSGSSLSAIRNWSIKVVRDNFNKLPIWASGGIMDVEDILISQVCGAEGVQLGTSVILNGIEYIDDLVAQYKKNRVKMFNYKRVFDEKKVGNEKTELKEQCAYLIKEKCIRCGTCLKLEYCDARINKYARFLKNEIIKEYFIPSKFLPKINPDYCRGCGLCMQVCKQGAIAMVDKARYKNGEVHFLFTKIISYKNVAYIDPVKCRKCDGCKSQTKCEAIMEGTAPKIVSELCNGCGKCVDKCSSHAIEIRETVEERYCEVRHS